jgi:hypothetical protein
MASAPQRGHLVQPADDAVALPGEGVARERGREVLLQWEDVAAPGATETPGRVAILALAEVLVHAGQVVLHGRHRHHRARAGQVGGGTHQLQIVLERAVPTPPLPGHRPPLEPGRRTDELDLHPALVDGPGVHGANAGGILGDQRLQHDEREPGRPVVLQLLLVQGKLARALADRVWQGEPEVARGEIDAVGLAHVPGELTRQLQAEALEITREQRAHPRSPGPRSPARGPAAPVPTDRRTPPAG